MRGLGGRTEPRVYEYHRAAWLSKNPGGKASRAEADVQYFKATRRIHRCEDPHERIPHDTKAGN